MRVRSIKLVSTAVLGLIASQPAYAQTSPEAAVDPVSPGTPAQTRPAGTQSPADTPPEEQSQTIGDIVVTAQRTESAAQKTPVALTVYSGAELRDRGVSDVQSLASIDPSVNFTSNNGTPYIAVRGIASTDTTEIGDPSVPLSRDGFFSNRPYALQLGLYDVARIEVLKGPQGTLNGRNSTGGLINVITNRPSKTSGGYGSVEVGNYGTFNGEMGVNAALADWIQARVSGVFRHHDGYRFLTGTNIGSYDEEGASIRAQVAIQPADALNLWVSYQHDDIDENGPGYYKAPIRTRPDFGKAKRFPGYAPIYNKVRGDRVQWEASYDRLPFGSVLTYAGGYEKLTYHNALDGTDPAFAYPATRQFRQNQFPRTWNHEVRIATPTDRFFSIQGGYFNFRERSRVVNSGIYNVACVGPFAPGGPQNALCQAGQFGIRFNFDVLAKSEAVFGQASFRFTDQLRLSLGARQTWDTKIRTGSTVLSLRALVSPFIGAPPITSSGNGNLKEDQAIFHAGVDYQITDANLLYAKFDTGYKAGGFNTTANGVTQYAPEKVRTAEVGSKNRFAGNRIQFNLAGFYTDYSNYQANQVSDGFLQVFNTGGAKIYGGEAQLTTLFGTGGQIDVNAAALHTEFDDGLQIFEGANVATGRNRPIGGNDLPNAPSFVIGGGVQQAVDVAGGSLTARVDGKYSSKFYYTVFNDPDTRQNSYFVGNAALTFAPANGVWQIQAYVKNFTNELILARGVRNFNSNTNEYEFQPPRTYGIRGSFKF